MAASRRLTGASVIGQSFQRNPTREILLSHDLGVQCLRGLLGVMSIDPAKAATCPLTADEIKQLANDRDGPGADPHAACHEQMNLARKVIRQHWQPSLSQSKSDFASTRSAVSKPSVNQL